MTVTALHSRTGIPLVGGYGPAMAAKEALTRELSAESHLTGFAWSVCDHKPCRSRHNQRSLRASRQGLGNDLGGVARVARKQEPRATADDARGDG